MKVLVTRAQPLQCGPQSRSRKAVVDGVALRRLSSWRLASHNQRAELQLGWQGPYAAGQSFLGPDTPEEADLLDVLGLGQAMVDLSAAVPDEELDRLQVEKGARKIIGVEERTRVLAGLDEGGDAYQVSAGGSLSNTLMALARLGSAAARRRGGRALRVGMAGLVGSDALGEFYSAQMEKAGVEVIAEPVAGANTGTVVVLTSPDAQRTMLSYLGTSCEIPIDPRLEAAIARSRVLVVEGYLWELPGAADAIAKAVAVAQKHGTVVAMTAGDAGVVHRHHTEMWAAIDAGIDLLFTNRSEAAALVQYEPQAAAAAQQVQQHSASSSSSSSSSGSASNSGAAITAEAAALRLAPHCSMICCTDGANGSVITALGQLHTVPPCWAPSKPVDTCGAGDAYAAGLLLGFLRGLDVSSMGRAGARVASAVISQLGATLSADAALALADALPLGADRSSYMRGLGTSQAAAPRAAETP